MRRRGALVEPGYRRSGRRNSGGVGPKRDAGLRQRPAADSPTGPVPVREAARIVAGHAGRQAVTGEQAGVAVAQAPLWGLGRVAALEHPELACRLVDFDPAADVATVAAQLQQELAAADCEDQVAYRGDQRLAARLRRAAEVLSDAEPAESQGRLAIPGAGPFRLRLGAAGSFDALRYESCARPSPHPVRSKSRSAPPV